jgi:hypothetical protein
MNQSIDNKEGGSNITLLDFEDYHSNFLSSLKHQLDSLNIDYKIEKKNEVIENISINKMNEKEQSKPFFFETLLNTGSSPIVGLDSDEVQHVTITIHDDSFASKFLNRNSGLYDLQRYMKFKGMIK